MERPQESCSNRKRGRNLLNAGIETMNATPAVFPTESSAVHSYMEQHHQVLRLEHLQGVSDRLEGEIKRLGTTDAPLKEDGSREWLPNSP